MFNFLRNWQSVFRTGCTILCSYQLCMRVSISPHPHQHLLLFAFFIIAILVDGEWYLIVVLLAFSEWRMVLSIFSWADLPFVDLLWGDVYLNFILMLWLGCLFLYHWVVSVVCIFLTKAFIRYVFWKYFSPSLLLVFSFSYWCQRIAKVLNFNEAQFINIFLLCTMLLMSCLRNLSLTQRLEIFLCFLVKVLLF